MQTEGQQRKERLIQWHEKHRSYYNDFIEKVSGPGHESLASLMFRLWSVDSHIYENVTENMENSGRDTVKLEGKKQKDFAQLLAKGVDVGDDFCSAFCYWLMFGDGYEQMFLMLEDVRINKAKKVLSLGTLPMLMRKYERSLVEASIKSGMRTAAQWLDYERDYNESNEDHQINVSRFLPQEGYRASEPCMPSKNEPTLATSLTAAEEKLIALMDCDHSSGEKVVRYIETYLSVKHSGKDAARMMIALKDSGLLAVKNDDFKNSYGLIEALHIKGLVGYRMAQGEFSSLFDGLQNNGTSKKYDEDKKEIEAIVCHLMRYAHEP